MSVLADIDIKALCENTSEPMISPFIPHQVKKRIIETAPSANNLSTEIMEQKILSYGLSSAGYDVRLERQFKIFKNTKCQIIDPLNMTDDYYDDHEGDFCIIPPNGYILGLTMEWFNIPRDVIVTALGKSTLARCGAIVNVTPIEPGWKGKVVIEIANASNIPIKIHSGMGVAQFVFHKTSQPCEVSYGDRSGKYQGQNSLVTARV